MLNISIQNWCNKELDYSIILLENDVIYTTDESIFLHYYLNNKFIDSDGNIYKVIDKKHPATWKRIFSFIPNFYKIKLIFEKTDDYLSLYDLKLHIINNINKLKHKENFEKKWLINIEKAENFEQALKI